MVWLRLINLNAVRIRSCCMIRNGAAYLERRLVERIHDAQCYNGLLKLIEMVKKEEINAIFPKSN
jgi:hypothetical protein